MSNHYKTSNNVLGDEVYESTRYVHEDNPWSLWDGMPHYVPKSAGQGFAEIELEFECDEAVDDFFKKIDFEVTDKTKSIWYPKLESNKYKGIRYLNAGDNDEKNYPKYPIYIVSKTRWEIRLTSDTLIRMGVKHYMVIEASQLEQYKAAVDKKWVTLLVLDPKYQDEYDTCDDLGNTKSKGPGAARNFAWDHSIANGDKRHWVTDDNISHFYRHDSDKRTPTLSGAIFRAMEDHSDRFSNCYMSGPHYRFFVVPGDNVPPFVQNCRIYSTNLIRNDIKDKDGNPLRWRGRYNEDSILSLDILSTGNCTIQYNAFTTGKLVTQACSGGNTTEFYEKEGTKPKSQMLADQYPKIAKVTWMHNRWHHHVDYAPFRQNRLIEEPNQYRNPDSEYGMELNTVKLKKGEQDVTE
jgi:hypothetical protein